MRENYINVSVQLWSRFSLPVYSCSACEVSQEEKVNQAFLSEQVLWLTGDSCWGWGGSSYCSLDLASMQAEQSRARAVILVHVLEHGFLFREMTLVDRKCSGRQRCITLSGIWKPRRVRSVCWRCDSGLLSTLLMSCYASWKATPGPRLPGNMLVWHKMPRWITIAARFSLVRPAPRTRSLEQKGRRIAVSGWSFRVKRFLY